MANGVDRPVGVWLGSGWLAKGVDRLGYGAVILIQSILQNLIIFSDVLLS